MCNVLVHTVSHVALVEFIVVLHTSMFVVVLLNLKIFTRECEQTCVIFSPSVERPSLDSSAVGVTVLQIPRHKSYWLTSRSDINIARVPVFRVRSRKLVAPVE